MNQKSKIFLKSILLLVVVLFSIKVFAVAINSWTEPTLSPPGGNMLSPVNVGGTQQYKAGSLILDGFRSLGVGLFDGYIKIGNTSSSCDSGTAGAQKYNGTKMQYCDGVGWKDLGGSSTISGTVNNIAMFTPSGTSIGNSSITQDGNTGFVGIGLATGVSAAKLLDVAGGIKTRSIQITGLAGDPSPVGKWLKAGINGFATWEDLPAAAAGVWVPATGGSINYVGGNVGIGTSDPKSLLHVYGSATLKNLHFGESLGANYIQSGNSQITDGSWLPLFFGPYGSGIADAKMMIDGSGNVGIGTTTPNSKLTVAGDLRLEGTTAYPSLFPLDPTENVNRITWPGHFLLLQNNGYAHNRVVIAPGGATSGTTDSELKMYSASASATPVYTQKIGFDTGGNNFFMGNLGIGTSSPSSKLTVAGTIESTTGGIKFPDGTVQATAYVPHGSQNFFSPGTFTFTVPYGVSEVFVTMSGGGGGGGGGGGNCRGDHSNYAGAGGGGGGSAGPSSRTSLTVTPNQSYAIVVGSGGSGGQGGNGGTSCQNNAGNANAGLASSFGSLFTVSGGGGGYRGEAGNLTGASPGSGGPAGSGGSSGSEGSGTSGGTGATDGYGHGGNGGNGSSAGNGSSGSSGSPGFISIDW